ncbi:hypothetical protein [Streptosporangium sp. NPDC051022]|uniref:hypothetical protein n=1 Tax=Streptosporangium sp. NPDC051022 TaxID=3155752 RepID=UPI0034275C48
MREPQEWLRADIEAELATAQAATQGDWEMYGQGDDDHLPYPAYPGEQTQRGHGWAIGITGRPGPTSPPI